MEYVLHLCRVCPHCTVPYASALQVSSFHQNEETEHVLLVAVLHAHPQGSVTLSSVGVLRAGVDGRKCSVAEMLAAGYSGERNTHTRMQCVQVGLEVMVE